MSNLNSRLDMVADGERWTAVANGLSEMLAQQHPCASVLNGAVRHQVSIKSRS